MCATSVQVYPCITMIPTTASPLTSFMGKLLLDSQLQNTQPDCIILNDNAKLHAHQATRPQSPTTPTLSKPQRYMASSSSLVMPLKRPQQSDYMTPSKSSLSSSCYSTANSDSNSSSRWNAINRIESVSSLSMSSSEPCESRWNNNVGRKDKASPGCLGLIRPNRNASHDDLSTLPKGNKKRLPSMGYKKMSIPRPKTGLKGRAQTV